MAPQRSRPGRWLAACFGVIALLYAGIAGVGQFTPKLGLDLSGGTSVILAPQLNNGQTLSKSAQTESVAIIRDRVNSLGVSEAEVETQGNNIIVSVPNLNRDKVLNLVGTTAELRFRQVLEEAQGTPTPQGSTTPGTTPTPAPSGSPSPPGTASPAPATSGKASLKPAPTTTAHGRALGSALLASPKATAGTPSSPAATTPTTSAATPSGTAPPAPATSKGCGIINTSTSCVTPEMQAAFDKANCSDPQFKAGHRPTEDPKKWFIACDKQGVKYLLAPAAITGKQVTGAQAGVDQQTGQTVVNLTLNGSGAKTFGDMTTTAAKLTGQALNQFAIVLDGVVESAPTTTEPILGGRAQISGGDLSANNGARAEELANVLKFGALPVTFKVQDVESVSATLGRSQLINGLLAGAIGLVLVVFYSLAYYRGLGLVTVASLLVSGMTIYALVTLLGHQINYRLSLAGIAGFIVAVGITADSFIVYFERLKDEIREGRTLRSGVERGWVRARRTIISADVVSLLAAVILYFVSVGNVRGFAFTLGLSTVTDLFIVFFFTKPMVTALSRTKLYGGVSRFSGLGHLRRPTPSTGRTVVKEA